MILCTLLKLHLTDKEFIPGLHQVYIRFTCVDQAGTHVAPHLVSTHPKPPPLPFKAAGDCCVGDGVTLPPRSACSAPGPRLTLATDPTHGQPCLVFPV